MLRPRVSALVCCRLAVAGVVASSAAYVTAKLAEAVGHASYVTALAIAKSLPGHKKKKQGKATVPVIIDTCAWPARMPWLRMACICGLGRL